MLVSVLAVPFGFVGTVAATEAATISAAPNTEDSSATHTVDALVESEDDGQALRNINIDYNSASSKANVENVSVDDVTKVGIDSDGDDVIDTDLSGSITGVEYSNNYHTITFKFDENYTLSDSDALIIAYEDVRNPPEPGEFQTQIAINYGSTDHPSTGTLNIIESTEPNVIDGVAVPDQVQPGTTVNNQKVHIEVANVSQDGNTDTHYVEFPDALAGGLSVNSASANATSITSSAQLVEGYDDDGTDETVKFATSGDDSSDEIDLNLTVDVNIDYPDQEATYDIDYRINGSNGTDTESGVASIMAGQAPTISDYQVTNPMDRDVHVSFNSTEELVDISVDITNSAGMTVATLTESDFSESSVNGTWVYEATQSVSQDGTYTATLMLAEDAEDSDAAEEQSGTVEIDAASVDIQEASANPSLVQAGTTVSDQHVHVVIDGVSADGNSDTHYVEFPDALASGLSVNSASVNGTAAIAQSAELVEGYDDDGTVETVRFQTDSDAGGTESLNVTVSMSVEYPDTNATYTVDARVEDSSGESDAESGIAEIEASSGSDGQQSDDDDQQNDGDDSDDTTQDTDPTIVDYSLVAADGEVTLTLVASAPLSEINVSTDGAAEEDLEESEFERIEEDGSYIYTTNISLMSDEELEATLAAVGNASGDGISGLGETVDVEMPPDVIAGASTVVASLEDEVTLALPGGVPVESVTIASANSSSGSVEAAVVDRPDHVAPPPGTPLSVLRINRPEAVENSSATITVSLSADALDTDATAYTVYRYEPDTDSWVSLDTSVVDADGSTVTLEFETEHTSMFAIAAQDDSDETTTTTQSTSTATATTQATSTDTAETVTPTPDDDSDDSDDSDTDRGTTTTTESGGPGGLAGPPIGIAVLLALLVGVGVIAVRRWY